MEELTFPTFDYFLDQSDPDVVILRRQDGSLVAAFSARGATKEGILEAAEENRRELIQAHTNPLGPKAVIVAPVTEGSGHPWYWGRGLEPVSVDDQIQREGEQHKLHVD